VEQPIVNHGAYEYGQTGLVRDFVMQSDPENLKVTE